MTVSSLVKRPSIESRRPAVAEFLAALTLLALVVYIIFLQGKAADLLSQLEHERKLRREFRQLADEAEARAALARIAGKGSTNG
jgi:cell division protein FtsB